MEVKIKDSNPVKIKVPRNISFDLWKDFGKNLKYPIGSILTRNDILTEHII